MYVTSSKTGSEHSVDGMLKFVLTIEYEDVAVYVGVEDDIFEGVDTAAMFDAALDEDFVVIGVEKMEHSDVDSEPTAE